MAEQIRGLLPRFSLLDGEAVGEMKMFGGLCFTLNGKMLMGVDKDRRLMVRLSDDDFVEGLRAGKVVPMDFTGRPLRNFAFLAPEAPDSDEDLLAWLGKSADYVRAHMLGKKK